MSICKRCLVNEALPNGTLCQSCRDQFGQYHVNLVLDDSNSSDVNFGVVKDCIGCYNFIPANSTIVGYWTIGEDGNLFITLMNSIQVMQDDLTAKITEFGTSHKKASKSKSDKSSSDSHKTPRVKKDKSIKPEIVVIASKTEETLNSLRNLFKKP